jgi:dynein heavy chain
LSHPKLKDYLEYAMAEGLALIMCQVENTIDPMFDPVLEKQYIVRGKKRFVNVSDKMMEIDIARFTCYFISRLPNPAFSPELQAKTCVVDFTVTQLGLEEQLLGRVIGKEQKALEEQLEEVMNEVNQNTKSLLALDASLLQRLTSNTGNLLEDEELIEVLATTKRKAKEVGEKLKNAAETKKTINEKREQFRPVATRGSVLYFAIVDMSGVNVMYQTSLVQFVDIFVQSMDEAEKAALAQKRVSNIIACMTYLTYRYINKGLYEKDKLTLLLVVTTKILVTAGMLTGQDIALFIRGAASLDRTTAPKKPFKWLTDDDAWYNAIQLSQSVKLFASLPADMQRNEAQWRAWFENDEPETLPVPDFEDKIAALPNTAGFLKLLLIRSLRLDRTNLVAREFVTKSESVKLPSGTDLPVMGPTFTDPVTDTMEIIYEQSDEVTPTIFLLSKGTNPTDGVIGMARKLKIPTPPCISMGEGMEIVGQRAIEAGSENGTWVMLENCELGMGLMVEMEDLLGKLRPTVHPNFRLWLSALPDADFPLGLLQMSTKCTQEPPAGLKAGIMRSFTVMVDQDKLERIDGQAEGIMWRKLVFTLCFLHSVVQERRKFGPLGWCIPYEYNQGDQYACLLFLEKHLYNGPISWPTVRYMVCDVQYGGKITDSLDRRLFQLYAAKYLTPDTLVEGYTFQPQQPILKIPGNFQYLVKDYLQLDEYKAYAASFPDIDSPEVLGLHPNADLSYRQSAARSLLEIVGNTQPKGGGGGGGGGPSKEEIVYEQAGKLYSRMPEDYVEDAYKAKIQALGGLGVPLNMFLFQEIQRFQEVLELVRNMLKNIQLAIKGEVVMTDALADGIEAMGDARAPRPWIYTVGCTEFAWIIPSISSWYGQMLNIDKQTRTWMENGRPNSYWMAGFSNPAGFLTAMTQEVARKHSKAPQFWALDEMVYHAEPTNTRDGSAMNSPPAEGCYLHMLVMDGGAFDIKAGILCESTPKILFVDLPVTLISANHYATQKKINKDMYGPQGPYSAPVYKYAVRGDGYPGNPDIKNFIFFLNLKCDAGKDPLHWGIRGLCLFCNSGN